MLTQLLVDPPPGIEPFSSGELYNLVDELEGERDLPEGSWPFFVRFEDIAHFSSLRLLPIVGRRYQADRQAPFQSFVSAFGGGARVESVKVEITTQRATNGRLEKILPWLDEVQGADRGVTERSASAAFHENLSHQNFILDGDSV